uniref:Uncharacterized protein n=1 Tax=Knipowitschia caucasica TaxID=637954 RepID=A0AAV2JLR3_KNICA
MRIDPPVYYSGCVSSEARCALSGDTADLSWNVWACTGCGRHGYVCHLACVGCSGRIHTEDFSRMKMRGGPTYERRGVKTEPKYGKATVYMCGRTCRFASVMRDDEEWVVGVGSCE